MSKNKTKKVEYETPEVKAVAPQTKEKGWEPAICPDGVKVMLEKGTRVVSQTEEIARLNKELDETRKQNVELGERVAKLTAEKEYVVTECDKLIERAKGSVEAANKDAARWLAELQDTRQNFRFWRFAAIAIAGCAILNAVWPLLGF
ncbi:MAG: hypothetical protein J6K25_10555 [Thermoguttaceae bacterium]|nr:hypothetical protein [Thermoguttaceae bacterium]